MKTEVLCKSAILAAFIIGNTCMGQNILISTNKLNERIIWQNEMFPQEKVHIMTDRELYLSGDTVWMRPFIVDGMTHRPVNRSRFLYVNLIDQQDSTQIRVKLHVNPEEKDSIMHGYLPLDLKMPTGTYTIVAYTQWMANTSEAYFFKHNITVVNPKEVLEGTNIKLEKTYNGPDNWHYCLDTTQPDNITLANNAMIHTEKQTYGQRKRVNVSIDAPAGTMLAASVTDDGFSSDTDEANSITSTLTGTPYIHNINDLERGQFRFPSIPFEDAQSISGNTVSLLLERPLSDVNVGIIAPQYAYADNCISDADGYFTFNDIDLPDGTVFYIRSYNDNQKSRGMIRFTPDPLPEKLHHLSAPATVQEKEEVKTDINVIESIRHRMEYNQGMWQMMLNEIEVVGRRKREVDQTDEITYTRRYNRKFIEENNISDLEELLLRIPGVRIHDNVAYYRQNPLGFVVDDVMMEAFAGTTAYSMTREFCHISWVESVELLNASQNLMYGNTSSGFFNERAGTIRIKTRKNASDNKFRDHYILRPLGYQKKAQFHPVTYSGNERIDQSDQRATLYWNPELRTDKDGYARFTFYTNDAYGTTISIRIEGISADGTPISQRAKIKIE